MTSKSTSDAYSSSGRQGGAFPSSTSVFARQRCSRSRRGNGGEVFGWKLGHQCAPRLFGSRCSWLCQKVACCYFDPSGVATRRRRSFRLQKCTLVRGKIGHFRLHGLYSQCFFSVCHLCTYFSLCLRISLFAQPTVVPIVIVRSIVLVASIQLHRTCDTCLLYTSPSPRD